MFLLVGAKQGDRLQEVPMGCIMSVSCGNNNNDLRGWKTSDSDILELQNHISGTSETRAW